MSEYSAAMVGVNTIEAARADAIKSNSDPKHLSGSDVNELKSLLKEKG